MEIRVIDHHIKIFEDGSQVEMVSLPLTGYDVIELFYLRQIFDTLYSDDISSATRAELDDAVVQIEDVLTDRLTSPSLGLTGDCLDVVV